MLLAVPCLWFARWGQCPDAFDIRCICWLQYIPIGHRNQALAVEGGGGGACLERGYCIKHLLEEEVSTRTGLIVCFWSVSWGQAFGQSQPRAAHSSECGFAEAGVQSRSCCLLIH